jgi:D-amino peptidase
MRVLISADMEGVTGVTHPEDCILGTPRYERFRPIFTRDVNSVAIGLFDAGVSEVLVSEAHGFMRNLVLEQLDPRIRMITGRHKTYPMMEGIQSRPELVAFVGYHAPAGGEGVLSHTVIGSLLVRASLNGTVLSEGLLNATLAAEYGARVALVSGDDKTCADAQGYGPHARLVSVKRAIDRYTADCLHPEVTAAQLREAGRQAVDVGETTAPEPPFECDIEFAVSSAAAACVLVPGVRRLDDRVITFTAETASVLNNLFTVCCKLATASSEPVYG